MFNKTAYLYPRATQPASAHSASSAASPGPGPRTQLVYRLVHFAGGILQPPEASWRAWVSCLALPAVGHIYRLLCTCFVNLINMMGIIEKLIGIIFESSLLGLWGALAAPAFAAKALRCARAPVLRACTPGSPRARSHTSRARERGGMSEKGLLRMLAELF